jgi:hypothetical protein
MADSAPIHARRGVEGSEPLTAESAGSTSRSKPQEAFERVQQIAERNWQLGIGGTTRDREAELLGFAIAVALGAGATLCRALADANGTAERSLQTMPSHLAITPVDLKVFKQNWSIFTMAIAKLATLCAAMPDQATAGLRWIAYEAARDLPSVVVDPTVAEPNLSGVPGEVAIAAARGAGVALEVALTSAEKRGMRTPALAHAAGINEASVRELLERRGNPGALLIAAAKAVAEMPDR